jgi:nucleoside-triphosphatase
VNAASSSRPKRNFLITGRPSVGKTTLILKVLQTLERDADGFYTRELKKKGRRVGFELVTLQGKRGILAHTSVKSPFRVGKYGIEIRALEELGVNAISRAIRNRFLIVIDEIGRMELYSTAFRRSVIEALNSPAPLLATIGPQPIRFLKQIKSRMDVELIELTSDNRDTLVTGIQVLLASA